MLDETQIKNIKIAISILILIFLLIISIRVTFFNKQELSISQKIVNFIPFVLLFCIFGLVLFVYIYYNKAKNLVSNVDVQKVMKAASTFEFEKVPKIISSISDLDFKKINNIIDEVSSVNFKTVENTIETVTNFAKKISPEQIIKTIDELKGPLIKVANKIENANFEEITKTINDVNKTVNNLDIPKIINTTDNIYSKVKDIDFQKINNSVDGILTSVNNFGVDNIRDILNNTSDQISDFNNNFKQVSPQISKILDKINTIDIQELNSIVKNANNFYKANESKIISLIASLSSLDTTTLNNVLSSVQTKLNVLDTEKINNIFEKIKDINFSSLSDGVVNVSNQVTSNSNIIKEVLTQLSTLNTRDLNNIVNGLSKKLENLDVEKLNTSIDNANNFYNSSESKISSLISTLATLDTTTLNNILASIQTKLNVLDTEKINIILEKIKDVNFSNMLSSIDSVGSTLTNSNNSINNTLANNSKEIKEILSLVSSLNSSDLIKLISSINSKVEQLDTNQINNTLLTINDSVKNIEIVTNNLKSVNFSKISNDTALVLNKLAELNYAEIASKITSVASVIGTLDNSPMFEKIKTFLDSLSLSDIAKNENIEKLANNLNDAITTINKINSNVDAFDIKSLEGLILNISDSIESVNNKVNNESFQNILNSITGLTALINELNFSTIATSVDKVANIFNGIDTNAIKNIINEVATFDYTDTMETINSTKSAIDSITRLINNVNDTIEDVNNAINEIKKALSIVNNSAPGSVAEVSMDDQQRATAFKTLILYPAEGNYKICLENNIIAKLGTLSFSSLDKNTHDQLISEFEICENDTSHNYQHPKVLAYKMSKSINESNEGSRQCKRNILKIYKGSENPEEIYIDDYIKIENEVSKCDTDFYYLPQQYRNEQLQKQEVINCYEKNKNKILCLDINSCDGLRALENVCINNPDHIEPELDLSHLENHNNPNLDFSNMNSNLADNLLEEIKNSNSEEIKICKKNIVKIYKGTDTPQELTSFDEYFKISNEIKGCDTNLLYLPQEFKNEQIIKPEVKMCIDLNKKNVSCSPMTPFYCDYQNKENEYNCLLNHNYLSENSKNAISQQPLNSLPSTQLSITQAPNTIQTIKESYHQFDKKNIYSNLNDKYHDYYKDKKQTNKFGNVITGQRNFANNFYKNTEIKKISNIELNKNIYSQKENINNHKKISLIYN